MTVKRPEACNYLTLNFKLGKTIRFTKKIPIEIKQILSNFLKLQFQH